jgi:hypothetical protein
MNEGPPVGWRRGRAGTRGTRHGRLGLVAGIVVCVTVFACTKPWRPSEPVGHRRTEVSSSAGELIGSHACYDCHDSFEQHFVASAYHGDCESCHGPGQLHAHTALARDIAYPGNGACADCHQVGSRTLLRWSTSLHARSDVLCTDCHDTHNREPLHLRLAGALESAKLPRAGEGATATASLWRSVCWTAFEPACNRAVRST